ncbi:fimbria/pilus periplasmic chaperone [Obesumbacterium proteus]|uniref:fimbria/pilus periplasmic chaperone n=1 Tax=Obesumbacterium proteus TaxID=82983 RepID=UPI00242FA683|nr:fimbria/pilus periplasmic chaperone [Obesumbacterium proteus]
MFNTTKQLLLTSLLFLPLVASHNASAGGVALGGTRLIYPIGNNQTSMPITNSDEKGTFLIQTWVENSKEVKTSDFVITPPLFAIDPESENTLRIAYVGSKALPNDRETVYWLNVKAIPATKSPTKDSNTLQIAVLNRIKLFMRPKNLPMKSTDAPAQLRFHRSGSQLVIKNPTPYYVTLVQFKAGSQKIPNTMVSPMESTTLTLPENAQGEITFQTVSDFGANSATQKSVME